MYRLFSILLIVTLNATSLMSQGLNEYRWKNRLVVILTDDSDAAQYEEQISLLKEKESEFAERKLYVIHLTLGQRRNGLDKDSKWEESSLYQKYRRTQEAVEVLLIGLDGGIKLWQTELLTTEKLFVLIDGMPMRKAEIKKDYQ